MQPIMKETEAQVKLAPRAGKQRKRRNTKIGFVKKLMREYTNRQFRISKEAPVVLLHYIEEFSKEIIMDAATIAMNAGRGTITENDIKTVVKIKKK